MQTVYEITFAHHIQLEEYRHVPMYYRTSKICPAISIHISMIYFSQQSLLSMCYRTLLTIYILPSYILGSLYFLLPLMTKLVSVYLTLLSSLRAIFLIMLWPTCLFIRLCLFMTMSTYKLKLCLSMTLLLREIYITSLGLFYFYNFPPI